MNATMHVYYWYGHKPSLYSELQAPWIPRPIEARQVLKSWNETQATRDTRLTGTPWTPYYMNLSNVDARSNADDTQTIDERTARGYICFLEYHHDCKELAQRASKPWHCAVGSK